MLRLEEVQFVNWGPLRPDTVPFMTHAVNLITGTNGSAKTCFVNGIKVLLGVRFPKESAPREYIFNPIALHLAEEIPAADRAILRGTFLNPFAKGGHRVFEYEGSEFQHCEHVTVVCVVQHEFVRYRILPNHVCWQDPISRSLEQFFEENPLGGQKWKGPQLYDQSLSRLGVSQAMRGVLALPQGETGEILKRSPAELLKAILQLTGKQEIIDAYVEERKKFEQAQAKYRETNQALALEKSGLEQRRRDAEKYEEWNSYRLERDKLRDVLVPAAEYRDLVVERSRLQGIFNGIHETVRTYSEALRGKEEQELPGKAKELEDLRTTAQQIRAARDSAERRYSRLQRVHGNLESGSLTATQAYKRALDLIRGRSVSDLSLASKDAAKRWRTTRRVLDEVETEIVALQQEAELLRSGHAAAPPEVREFRSALVASGIETLLVADVLEPAGLPARQIEAALGDAVWALVIPESEFSRAAAMAEDAQYPFPLARVGSGHPAAVLAATRGPDEVLALLADLDIPATANIGVNGLGQTGASADGFFQLPSMVQLRAPAAARIGAGARAERLRQIGVRLLAAEEEHAALMAKEAVDAKASRELAEAMELLPQLEDLCSVSDHLASRTLLATSLRGEAQRIHKQRQALTEQLAGSEGRLDNEVQQLKKQIEKDRSDLGRYRGQLEAAQTALSGARAAVEAMSPSDTQREVFQAAINGSEAAELRPTDELKRKLKEKEDLVSNEERFPQHLRTDQVLSDRDEQVEVVRRADEALESVAKDMEAHQNEVDRARQAYDNNVGATIRLLNSRFAEICQSANVIGELHRLTGDVRGEYGLDVRVAHKAGERPISYQRRNFHSGGQTVKIAILLLLAAMSMGDEGSAEMLIMDEPIAHMSVENADQVAEVIVGLKDRAQFILAMPTNAETLRVDWAEWQISLLARQPGEPRSPVPQILSELKVDLATRFESPQLQLETA